MTGTFPQFAYVLLALLIWTSGCHTSAEMAKAPSSSSAGEYDASTSFEETRKLVYKGTLSLVVRNEPDSIMSTLRLMAESSEGYLSTMSSESITLRVPVEKFESFMNAAAALGEVENRFISANDVTDKYVDVSIRLENAQKARETYLGLLERAATVTEALEVEKELERINEVIDRLEGQMRLMNNQVDLATITVYVREQIKPGPIGYVGVGVWKAVSWLFVRG